MPPSTAESERAPPTVTTESYLTLHYRLSDESGEEFVSTFDLSPATIQMGSGQLAVPLEHCLIGMAQGERNVVTLAPADAFGERNPRLVERIARAALPPEVELAQNALIEFGSPSGDQFAGFVRDLDDRTVLIDFNHPLAGKTVRFEVEIIGIM